MNNEWIFGSGPSSATLMIIGDSPNQYDEQNQRHFTGPSGELLSELLETTGSSRSQVYLTNIIKIRPPKNDTDLLGEINNSSRDYNSPEGIGYKIDDFIPLLKNEIETMQPNCILALGSLACKILTGKEGIKYYRGSILPCIISERDIKVIPTIHPSALTERNYKVQSGEGMFSWKQKSHVQFDVMKAVRESKFPQFDIPKRDIEIIKSSIQLERFFDTYIKSGYNKVYVDVEVFKAHVVCIGFAFTPHHACSVSLINLQNIINHEGMPLHEMVEIWRIVYEKLENPNLKKSGQNFKADKVYWLETAGFVVNNFYDDGMFKFHTLSPELPKSLAFQASVLTNEPYYKSEGKEFNPYKDNVDNLLRYNGRDCAVNCECDLAMEEDLKELGLSDFFYNFVMACYPIYEKMEKKGILIDKEKKNELTKFYDDKLIEEGAKRSALLFELGIDSDINYNSPKQVGSLIYGALRCKERKDTADQTLTALANNAVKDVRKKKIIHSILDSRSLDKIKTVYTEFEVDYDGRARCTYNQVGTETGRTSTSIIKKPLRNGKWGVPFQTVPRPDEFGGRIREMFIPDPGKIFIEPDQSQAEARIVALLANDLDLLKLFDLTDVHKLTASFLYGLTIRTGEDLIKSALAGEKFDFLDNVIDEQRQVGKASRHGFGYDLGEEGLSIKMKISLYRAKIAFQKISEMSPKIKGVFHEDVQAALADNNRVFITPFGRRREFFNKWGKELFREAYAHIPQSTIGDNTKRCLLGIKDIDWIEILAEMHDGFLAQIPEGRQKDFYDIVKPIFEEPIDFSRGTLPREPIIIPVEFKMGENWGQLKKYKGD